MNRVPNADDIVQMYKNLFKDTKPYSFKDAFLIEDTALRAVVFSAINVEEMMAELGTTRLSVEGIDLVNKEYIPETGKFVDTEFTQLYELHAVDGSKLGIEAPLRAIRCWCTSTDKVHWLWAKPEATSPLEAIAANCMVFPTMLNKIKHIIRQGDVFLFEMKEPVVIDDQQELQSLDKDTYFSLLKCQS